MPIELIDKIKPKNDGDFKLVDYQDIDNIEEFEIEEQPFEELIKANPELIDGETLEKLKTIFINGVKYDIVPAFSQKADIAQSVENIDGANVDNIKIDEILEYDEEEGGYTGNVNKAVNAINSSNLIGTGSINGKTLDNFFITDENGNITSKVKEASLADNSINAEKANSAVYSEKIKVNRYINDQSISINDTTTEYVLGNIDGTYLLFLSFYSVNNNTNFNFQTFVINGNLSVKKIVLPLTENEPPVVNFKVSSGILYVQGVSNIKMNSYGTQGELLVGTKYVIPVDINDI